MSRDSFNVYDDVAREARHDYQSGNWDRGDTDGPGPDDLSGRGDPAQGDTWNDRRIPGGTQPRRSEPRGKPKPQDDDAPF